MNEEIKKTQVEPEVAVEAEEAQETSMHEEKQETHVTFEILKGKDNEHKFYFSIPKQVSLGIAYDAAFEMINHINKTIQEMTDKLAPKKEEEKKPEGEEK